MLARVARWEDADAQTLDDTAAQIRSDAGTGFGAIERELMRGGFVERYRADEENAVVDGLPPGEGVFLPCSFWLAAVLAQQGRQDDAVALYERLLALRNDLGLISEEYDPERGRLLGNFPQAFTHIGIVETAFTLSQLTND